MPICSINPNLYSYPKFKETVKFLIDEYKPTDIVETGTFLGEGSTRVFQETGLNVFTIEARYENYFYAKELYKQKENVALFWGYSLLKDDMLIDLMDFKEWPKHIIKDSSFSEVFYLKELFSHNYLSPLENLLFKLINNSRKQIVFLDSAGGVGFLEYQKFIELPQALLKNKILLLDDINHLKHYKSVKNLEENGYAFNKFERFGYCSFMENA